MTSRLGLGAAYVPFAEVDGDHFIGRLPVTDRQREQAWVGEMRVRLASGRHAAFDAAAGAGILRQQRRGEYVVATCGPTCVSTFTPDAAR
ncbi:MAG: hypothetical protein R2712_32080, partial [Vicinamibacterales bacterium]